MVSSARSLCFSGSFVLSSTGIEPSAIFSGVSSFNASTRVGTGVGLIPQFRSSVGSTRSAHFDSAVFDFDELDAEGKADQFPPEELYKVMRAEVEALSGEQFDVHAARRAIVNREWEVDFSEVLGEIEDREIDLAHSDRSKTPIEPYLADQWFVKMDELAQTAMDAVSDGRVKIIPDRYAKSYLDWLSEKRDWPVGRQLWWGHRIPIWRKMHSK